MEQKQYKATALFEVSFNANGSNFLVVYGQHINGYYCCIPNWKIGCEMAEPADTFYNYEKLCGAGLNKNDAKAIAEMIKTVGAEKEQGIRNYGRIQFEKDLVECLTVAEGVKDDGNKYELAITSESANGELRSAPVVKFKNRTFILHWEDMVALASKAGLFDESESAYKALLRKGVTL
ncbi:MAG: hypothetical protein HDQ88_10635 [Clostridia bacterium]|nr:hypothetical protein [Clostridia bacterium]